MEDLDSLPLAWSPGVDVDANKMLSMAIGLQCYVHVSKASSSKAVLLTHSAWRPEYAENDAHLDKLLFNFISPNIDSNSYNSNNPSPTYPNPKDVSIEEDSGEEEEESSMNKQLCLHR